MRDVTNSSFFGSCIYFRLFWLEDRYSPTGTDNLSLLKNHPFPLCHPAVYGVLRANMLICKACEEVLGDCFTCIIRSWSLFCWYEGTCPQFLSAHSHKSPIKVTTFWASAEQYVLDFVAAKDADYDCAGKQIQFVSTG
uniref:Uncharacterized protein n=1 Tax=Musa acuminata subsp. malaccensis TaxID=214687 RepID=A0A804IED4_MUSAM